MPKMRLTLKDFENFPTDSKLNLKGLVDNSDYLFRNPTPEEQKEIDGRKYREKLAFLYTLIDMGKNYNH